MADLDIGLLILRLVVGLTFAVHGAQKVFGWWSGPGMTGWTGAMHKMGFQPAGAFAVVSAGAELVGGLFLALGLLTPLAGMVLVGQSVVIIGKAHLPHGFFNSKGGYEYPLALAGGVAAITLAGPGSISLDSTLGVALTGVAPVVLVLIGIVGGLASLALSSMSTRQTVATQR